MPSREVVEIVAAEDDAQAPVKSAEAATEARSVVESEDSSSAMTTSAAAAAATNMDTTTTSGVKQKQQQQQRKITPGPATDKKQEAALKKKAAKQQLTLGSFFGKGKSPFTPHVNAAKAGAKKQTKASSNSTHSAKKKPAPKESPKAAKSQKAKPTESSPTLAAARSSLDSSSGHNKMDFKDVIVGKLSKHSAVKSSKPKSKDAASKPAVPVDDDDKLDSLLPRIPPVRSVQSQHKSAAATKNKSKPKSAGVNSGASHQGIREAPSQDESEAASIEMGAVKSQLVHIFENPPSAEIEKEKNLPPAKEADKATERDQQEAAELSKDSTASTSPASGPAKEDSATTTAIGKENGEALGESGKHEPCLIDQEVASSDASNNEKEGPVEGQSQDVSTDSVVVNPPTARPNLDTAPTDIVASSESLNNAKADDKTTENSDASTAKPTYLVDAENQALLLKHEAMQVDHYNKVKNMVAQGRDGLDVSGVVVAMPSTENIIISTDSISEFPDAAVPHLLTLLEGSKLPLSVLAKNSRDALNTAFSGAAFSLETVSSKIKVLSARKAYIKNPAIALGTTVSNNLSNDINIFEDVDADHLWRWEVVSLDLLPDESVKAIKLARSARRKLQQQFNATARLLAALDESIKLLQKGEAKPAKAKLDKVVGKISREEDKVLKFEQDVEKARLAAESKKLKQAKKQHTSKEEKDRLVEEKKTAAEQRKKEKEEAKQKKALEREEDKQKKALEREEDKQKKAREREEAKRQKEEKARAEQAKKSELGEKNKKRMMSFFSSSSSSKKSKKNDIPAKQTEATKSSDLLAKPKSHPKDGFDIERFRSSINSSQVEANKPKSSVFAKLSKRARVSRRPKTKRVKMRVFVSGQNAADPFAAQPAFAEERIVDIRNRNKFLSFTEDCRPAWHGTWSKRSSVAKRLGRNPFLKDASLDYDVDSEAEWEEGDDDPGEDVENDVGDDEEEKLLDEEGDTRVYNYQDGWLAQDDEMGEEDDMDDETKDLLRATRKRKDVDLVPVCIIAPADGGAPIVDTRGSADPLVQGKVEGFPVEEAVSLISSHTGAVLVETQIFLDAFPPVLVDEREVTTEQTTSAQSNEPSEEDMRTIARFVHHSALVSKSQVVEELRSAHQTVTASRAQAQRLLDSMAEKKRHPQNGVYWEVKQDVVDKLGLADELKPMPLPEPEAPKKKDGKKRKMSEDSADKKAVSKKTEKVKASTPVRGTPKTTGSTKKKKAQVSTKSASLFKAFLGFKK